ncbi:MAG: hypothetical protein VKJ24_14125 [Synechococcales bacterium]|nr:hypothetical protein [Synechococcales bacterium]
MTDSITQAKSVHTRSLQSLSARSLSPLARYELHKLLQRAKSLSRAYTQRFQVSPCKDSSITTLSIRQRMQQLEVRLLMHQRLMHQGQSHYDSQACSPDSEILEILQHEIFQLLGFQLSQTKLRSQIIAESEANCFKFAYKNDICDALERNGQYYGFILSVPIYQSIKAYRYDWLIRNFEIATVLTISSDRYRIWIDLRSASYPILRKQSYIFLQRLQTFHSIMKRFDQTGDQGLILSA